MRVDPGDLPPAIEEFLAERWLATLTTLHADGRPHVVPVGFSYDSADRIAWVITSGDSVKARNAGRPEARAALCQVDGARWLTLSGIISVERDPELVAEAERRYAARYRPPRANPKRVVLVIGVTELLGSTRFAR